VCVVDLQKQNISGILNIMKDEDGVAMILCHEMAHVVAGNKQ
jgi:Zn-dependent protease with chaperone function